MFKVRIMRWLFIKKNKRGDCESKCHGKSRKFRAETFQILF